MKKLEEINKEYDAILSYLDRVTTLVITIDKLNQDARVKGCGTSKRAARELESILVNQCQDYAKKRELETQRLYNNARRNAKIKSLNRVKT